MTAVAYKCWVGKGIQQYILLTARCTLAGDFGCDRQAQAAHHPTAGSWCRPWTSQCAGNEQPYWDPRPLAQDVPGAQRATQGADNMEMGSTLPTGTAPGKLAVPMVWTVWLPFQIGVESLITLHPACSSVDE